MLAVLLIASVGIAAGALWEVAEWAFDQVAPGDVIKSKHDTILDILMDTGGALVAGVLALRLMEPDRGTADMDRKAAVTRAGRLDSTAAFNLQGRRAGE